MPEHKLKIVPGAPGLPWLSSRPRIPGVVGMVAETGHAMTLGPEAVAEVADWIKRVGWRPGRAPVRLVRVAR